MKTFLESIDHAGLKTLERARAVLWWIGREDSANGTSTAEICKAIEGVGHPKQNASRLAGQLSKDRKVISRVPGKNAWRLNPQGRKELDLMYASLVLSPKKSKPTDSVMPRSLFVGTRSYIEKVVFQINGSYDNGFFDCSAVMCRRLLETLLIELYESVGRATDIQGADGNFFMFADLLHVFEKDVAFNMSRNGRQGLRDFKKLGDLSAHNRRFNARKEDIDRIRDGVRIASEELLHMARLI